MTTTAPVRVDLDGRRFYVLFDEHSNPSRIIERKKCGKPPYDGYCNLAYWSAKHHALGKGSTIPKRVIDAAKAILNAAP